MTEKHPINPAELCAPVGFAHGWLTEQAGLRLLHLAGQCAHGADGRIRAVGDLVGQVDQALANIGHVLRAAGMEFTDVVQLNFYVCSRDDYATARRILGEVWRRHCGRHYPAMAMLMVAGLYDPDALIEVQGVATR